MGLVLRNLDTKNEIALEEGVPLTIGRGDLAGCSDKRVSRKHGQLIRTPEDKLQVKALHTNPCLIMKQGLPPLIQLKKDEETVLEDGDYFGLLPDACWFEIVKKDSSITNGRSPEKTSIQDKPSTSSPLPKVTVSESPTSNVPPELEKTKKLPLWMYEIDEPKEAKKSPAKRPHLLGAEDSGGKKVKTELSPRMDRTSPSPSPERQTVAAEDVKVELPDVPKDEPKTDSVDPAITPKKEKTEGESSKSDEKDGYESDAAAPEEPSASSDSPRRRPVCQYEGTCYRKNPQHKQEFSHPGDADYVRPENRPQCPYGASCYRQNALHRVEYQHPTSTPAPRPQPQPQSPASPASPLPAKRKRKTRSPQPRDSEEDDYDLDDPFINDASSDDYAPTESDSDEDDDDVSDLSQQEKDDLKRLKKEAKRAAKNKRKNKNK